MPWTKVNSKQKKVIDIKGDVLCCVYNTHNGCSKFDFSPMTEEKLERHQDIAEKIDKYGSIMTVGGPPTAAIKRFLKEHDIQDPF